MLLFDCLLLQKCVHGIKGTEFFFDDAPHDAVVNGVIAVDKDVSEGDDVTVLGEICCKSSGSLRLILLRGSPTTA